MNHDGWLHALAGELHRRGVDPDLSRHVVAEAATHLRDSGEPPLRVFGAPAAYATAVAESVGVPQPAGTPGTGRGTPQPAAGVARVAGPAATAPRGHGPVRLEVRGITKRYRRRPVLSGVDLTVRAGEIAAVVGLLVHAPQHPCRADRGRDRRDPGAGGPPATGPARQPASPAGRADEPASEQRPGRHPDPGPAAPLPVRRPGLTRDRAVGTVGTARRTAPHESGPHGPRGPPGPGARRARA
ncbi:hypothetical protein ACN27G_23320 [Plantactinospora sp. WMMB334]|uniref:hypothetical protein n=1 Tax=Plantactinospora sp. WMMB334 TaxID=3404119 RepID=UPI003B9222DD